MNIYEFGVRSQIDATLYVRADSPSDARKLAQQWLIDEDTDDCYLDEDRYIDPWEIVTEDLFMEE